MCREDTDLHDSLIELMGRIVNDVLPLGVDVSAKGQDGLDFVTSTDLALQARLEADLTKLLPHSRVIGEEGFVELELGNAPVWLVDPLDGTVNFVAGLPTYAMAVVLLRDGVPVIAAIRDIPAGTTYSAIAGRGAFLDGAPLTRKAHSARLAVLSSGLLRDMAARCPTNLAEFLTQFKLRNLGSQALHLCHAAAGHISLVASREAKGWDDMAGALIAREAGLIYGHYGPTPSETGAEQMSLCAPAELFANYATILAQSLPISAEPQPEILKQRNHRQ